jgi:hypothetical protein
VAKKMRIQASLFPEDKDKIETLIRQGATTTQIEQYLEEKVIQERKHADTKREQWQFDTLL